LCQDAGDGRNRQDNADACLVPLLLGEQVNREIRTKPVAHVGEEEVGRVEGAVRLPQLLFVLVSRHLTLQIRSIDCQQIRQPLCRPSNA
jgi:hypothetical protein